MKFRRCRETEGRHEKRVGLEAGRSYESWCSSNRIWAEDGKGDWTMVVPVLTLSSRHNAPLYPRAWFESNSSRSNMDDTLYQTDRPVLVDYDLLEGGTSVTANLGHEASRVFGADRSSMLGADIGSSHKADTAFPHQL